MYCCDSDCDGEGMKFLLIATALNFEAVYPDADMCAAARFALEPIAPTAVCIPNPESYKVHDQTIALERIFRMIKEFRESGN